ncbi:MAG TPA: metallopeptidase TldD-related protein [Terriglobales bacterium]|nr:metallopeptidase TldD-related protein [Terriglobales bacterium]
MTVRRTLRLLLTAFLLASPLGTAAQAVAKPNAAQPAADDPVLRAMLSELGRSKEKLQLKAMQRPYYIEYSVSDIQAYSADATFGALRLEQGQRARLLRAVVRIGNYTQDSYFGQGEGYVEVVPQENDELALRHVLWLATDTAYKNALEALTLKQSMLKDLVVEQQVDDFSREPAIQSIQPLIKNEADSKRWREMARSTSALFRRDPQVDSSEAGFRAQINNRYFVNTEGSITRKGVATYFFYFGGGTQSPDGMRLQRSQGYVMARPEELPSPEKIRADAGNVLDTLAALRLAPVVEDSYVGPVLFSSDAANTVFNTLVVPAITGDKPQPGDPARTSGDYASRFKSRVLPPFLSLVDDPTVTRFQDQTLVGSYSVDDEGVKAQPVTVVENGTLVNYLIGRRPIRDFPHSNGHGLAAPGGSARPAIGNLFVRASESFPVEQLKKRMLDKCRDQGRPYGYLVETTGPDLAPRLLYRVYVKDGHQELVRGAVFGQLDARALRNDLLAVGNDADVEGRPDPVPNSLVTPSLLFEELEIKRADRVREKLPQYPPPALAAGAPAVAPAGKSN